jgi:hypothetical protein
MRRHRYSSQAYGYVILIIVLFAGFMLWTLASAGMRQWECYNNVESLALALQMYANDYDMFPRADSWCDDTLDYTKNKNVYFCPARKKTHFGYAMNSALSGVNPKDVKTPLHRTILIFESDVTWNGSGGIKDLPEQPRHRDGDMYGYAGGEMNSEHPLAQMIPRASVMDGTADIYWDPGVKSRDALERQTSAKQLK